MDDLKHLEGKAVRSIEQNNAGLNSYMIIKFTDDSKLNIAGYPHNDNGVAQLDIALDQIKLLEIKNRKISTIEEEFDGQMDKLIIKFKQGGKMVIGAFNSKENGTAGLETTVYVENKKKFVQESLDENIKNPRIVSRNYRDRWSELPEGEYDLVAGEIVDLINNPGIGSIHVRKEDGTDVFVAGFSGHILKQVNENEYKDGRWGNYIMNSPQYEEVDSEEEEKENKNKEMKKFVSESLNEFADWYNTDPEEYDDEMDGPNEIDEPDQSMMTPYSEDELDMEDLDNVNDYIEDDDIEDAEDTYGDIEDDDDNEKEIDVKDKIFDPEDDAEEIEISSVDYDELESIINNAIEIKTEIDKPTLQFKLKSTGEEIEAKPMAKLSNGTKVIFKTADGLISVAMSDIILESKKEFKWVKESLNEVKKKKFKPADKGKMKFVKVDDKTTIEVPVSVSDEEAIKKHKEKMANRGEKWG